MTPWGHVYPIDDEQEHDIDSDPTHGMEKLCHCQPELDWEFRVVIHSSFDGRELLEQAEKILDQPQQ